MHSFKSFALAMAVLSCASVTSGQTSASESVPKIEFEKYTLANGAQIILHVDRKLPIVHVKQWFHVGSANEVAGRSGFAHLFEHMMFQGSKNAGKYFSYVETMGANLSENGVNGTTSWDRTNYFATVPSGSLENLLWLESDRLATLPEGLTQQKLDNQRDVVKNERRQGLENVPYGKWIKVVSENLYPARHPYANDVIGTHEDLTAASMEDVKNFFRTYYTPNHLSLVIAGDFDPANVKKLIDKYFGTIPPSPPIDMPVRWIPKLDGPRIVESRDRVPQERVYAAWPTPAWFESGDADLDLLGNILTDGLSARLNKALVYDRQLCSDTVSFQFSRPLVSMFLIWATARPGVPLPQVEAIIAQEIGRVAKEGPTEAELNRAKAKWESQFVTGLERIGGFGGKADLLNQYNTFLGDPNKFEADVRRHRDVSEKSVREITARWLDTPNHLTVRFHPETSGRELQIPLDRSKKPPLGADRPFEVPKVESAKLENGLEIFVVERRELPKVAVALATKAGSVRDPRDRDGVADLTARTMKYGTASRKALEIEDKLGDLGTQLNGSVEDEQARLELDVLKRNLGPAMAILADVVRDAAFPAAEFEREKKIRLDSLSQDSKDPHALSARIAAMLAFGQNHPYGRPARGLPETVQRITRDDLVRFHHDYWKPASSALVIAGKISLAESIQLVRENFGAWTGGAAPDTSIPAPNPRVGKVYVVDRQDAAQTQIAEILPAPARKSPEYYALELADAVWGGGFKTRLNLNLREEKGYSYGVFSSLEFHSQSGMWVGSGGVQTNKTSESVAEFRKELANLAGDRPITQQELDDAKANRTRAYAQQFESLNHITVQIANLWQFGLPVAEELQREVSEIQNTPLAAVNAAAQKYAPPANTSLLLVGDWAKIQDGLRRLDLGPIVLLDEQGRPKSPVAAGNDASK